jgi:glutamine amidotransferase-like uncharacterized protein
VKKILFYWDEGVDGLCASHALAALRGLSLRRVQKVTHKQLTSEEWEDSAQLLVMPGGRDLAYVRLLAGEGNRRIRRFVEQGGGYLGLCAGGYYGASSISFEQDGPLEVVGPRELAFFAGKAVGPAYGLGQFQYQSEAGIRAASIIYDGGAAPLYFNGGCTFVGEGAQVLARYGDLEGQPSAIVQCQVGAGRAILCGVHPEMNPWRISARKRPWVAQLRAGNQQRLDLWRGLINRLL